MANLYTAAAQGKTASETKYIDAAGNLQKGYIIDGVTYQDANGASPVGVGSIVNTEGGTYIKTDKGSMLYSDYIANNPKVNASYIDADGTKKAGYTAVDYSAMLDQANQERDDAKARAEEIYRAQLQKNEAEAQEQIDEYNRGMQDTNRQLYRDYMINQSKVPQALAAQGINGGMAESSLIKLASGYEEQLGQNERERLANISKIRSGVTDAQLQLAVERANAEAEAENDLYTRKLALMQAAQEQENFNRQQDNSEEDTKYTRALEAAKIAAQLGDVSLINELLGIKATTGTATGSSGTVASNPYTLTLKEAENAFNNGIRSEEVLSVLRNYYGQDGVNQMLGIQKTPTAQTSGYSDEEYRIQTNNISTVKNMVWDQLLGGNGDGAFSVLNDALASGAINVEGWEQIMNELGA